MKKNLLLKSILALVVMTFVMMACTEDVVNTTNNLNRAIVPLTAANPANSYDSAGIVHNECLDYVIDNANNGLSLSDVGIKQNMKALIEDYYTTSGVTYGVPSGTVTLSTYVCEQVDSYFDNVEDETVEDLITEFAVSSNAENEILSLIDIIVDWGDSQSNPTENDYQDLVDDIIDWETAVGAENYTSAEFEQLLSMGSVYRYSVKYWFDVSQDTTSEWYSNFTVQTVYYKSGSYDIALFEWVRNEPTWYKCLVCGLADGFGWAVGGPVGSITGSAIMGGVAWWDDLGDFASSIGNAISGAVTAVGEFFSGLLG